MPFDQSARVPQLNMKGMGRVDGMDRVSLGTRRVLIVAAAVLLVAGLVWLGSLLLGGGSNRTPNAGPGATASAPAQPGTAAPSSAAPTTAAPSSPPATTSVPPSTRPSTAPPSQGGTATAVPGGQVNPSAVDLPESPEGGAPQGHVPDKTCDEVADEDPGVVTDQDRAIVRVACQRARNYPSYFGSCEAVVNDMATRIWPKLASDVKAELLRQGVTNPQPIPVNARAMEPIRSACKANEGTYTDIPGVRPFAKGA